MWESIYISGNLEKTQSTSIFPLFRVTRYQYISYIFFAKLLTQNPLFTILPLLLVRRRYLQRPQKAGKNIKWGRGHFAKASAQFCHSFPPRESQRKEKQPKPWNDTKPIFGPDPIPTIHSQQSHFQRSTSFSPSAPRCQCRIQIQNFQNTQCLMCQKRTGQYTKISEDIYKSWLVNLLPKGWKPVMTKNHSHHHCCHYHHHRHYCPCELELDFTAWHRSQSASSCCKVVKCVLILSERSSNKI